MNSVSVLNVHLYGELIGTITNQGNDRSLFAFTEDYIDAVNRPTLSLGFKNAVGGIETEFNTTQTKLMPFFSNLLPEGHMRDYLADRAGVNPEREFYLLWALGQDLPGAITVESADGEPLPPGRWDNADANENDQEAAMRFSLAGVQLKFSAVQDASGGLTIPVEGAGGSWIVKLPSSRFDEVPENEFAMMRLASQIGIDVPETRLVNVDQIQNIPEDLGRFGETAFAIKRFDRAEDRRPVHTEDFAQIFRVYPRDKYKKASMRNIAYVIGMEGQDSDIKEFVRRLVFNTLIGNADMHLKNWSFIYRDRVNASIAPAYDFVSTIPYIQDRDMALKVSRSKAFADFTMDELSHLAAKAMLNDKLVIDTARETMSNFREAWMREKSHLPISNKIVTAIDWHLKSIPLFGES